MAQMNLQNSKESFELVANAKPTGGDTENSVASVIRALAWVTIFCGLILGFLLGKDPYDDEFSFVRALIYWFAGFVSGMMLMGFSEIIRLLQLNATKEYSVYCNLKNVVPMAQEPVMQTEAPASAASVQETAVEQDIVSVNESEKAVHFATRPKDAVVCPLCGTRQQVNRIVCFTCGVKFIFDDEEADGN